MAVLPFDVHRDVIGTPAEWGCKKGSDNFAANRGGRWVFSITVGDHDSFSKEDDRLIEGHINLGYGSGEDAVGRRVRRHKLGVCERIAGSEDHYRERKEHHHGAARDQGTGTNVRSSEQGLHARTVSSVHC